jgi:hypothetical protein
MLVRQHILMPSDTFLCVTIHCASFVRIFRWVSAIVRETRLYQYKYLNTKELLFYLQIAAFYSKISLLTKMFKDHIATGLCEAESFIVVVIMVPFPEVSTFFRTSTRLLPSIFVSHRLHCCRSDFVYHVWNTQFFLDWLIYLFSLHSLYSDVNIQNPLRYLIIYLLWCFSQSEVVAWRWTVYCEHRWDRQCVTCCCRSGHLWKKKETMSWRE